MSFTGLKKEINLLLERLKKECSESNARTDPSDAAEYPTAITVLEGDIMLIEDTLNEISKVTDRIDNLQAKTDNPQTNADIEVLRSGSTSKEGYLKYIYDGKKILANIRVNVVSLKKLLAAANPAPAPVVTQPATLSQQSFDNLLLPKIRYERFNGDKKKYILFKNRFKQIENNSNIDDVDKLSLLLGFLDGPAKELLNQYSLSAANYALALKDLDDTHGNKDDVIRILFDEFDGLKRQSDSVADTRKCFNESEVILKQLQQLGEDVNQKAFQHKWEKYMIPPWLLDECLTKLNASDQLQKFREEADKILTRKEKVSERTNESSSTVCNVSTTKGKNPKVSTTPVKENPNKKKATDKKKPDLERKKICIMCKGEHASKHCEKYRTLSQRLKVFEEQNRCKKCGRFNHTAKECKAKHKCGKCNSDNHHVALCPPAKSESAKKTNTNVVSGGRASKNDDSSDDSDDAAPTVTAVTITTTAAATAKATKKILPIVEVPVSNPRNKEFITVPVLMDSASQLSYVTHEYAELLKLPVVDCELLNIETFNAVEDQIKHSRIYSLLLQLKNGQTEKVLLHGIDRITRTVTMALPDDLDNIQFKDVIPSILIGGKYFWSYFKTEETRTLPSGFHLVSTEFGNIVCGEGPTVTKANVTTLSIQAEILDTIRRIEQNIENQWNFEQAGIFDDPNKSEREIVDEFFEETFYRNPEGRFVVRMPWNTNNPVLKDHLLLSYYRLKSLVTSLKKKGKLNLLMSAFDDHIQREYIEYVTPEMDEKAALKHYIPYHIVEKDSATTPCRVVFDCSASHGPHDPSLNSNLYSGPPKMPDIIGLLIRFRCYAIVVIADVAKAFMQLLLHESDRDVFRFLMLKDPEKDVTWDNIRICRYTRPLFGAGPSPLLLEQVIKYVLKRNPDPVALEILLNLFVDNVMFGAATIAEALRKARIINAIFEEMKMNLRDYVSNAKEVSDAMDTVIPNKTTFLGIPWIPKTDTMITVIPQFKTCSKTTKRVVLSAIASIYDPPGLLAPVLLSGRNFIQSLWRKKYSWDSQLDKDDCEWWAKFKSVNEGKQIEMQRYIISPEAKSFEIHIFCDASQYGISAAVYLRQILPKDEFLVNLIMAKARVTPLEKASIPKLELAAVSIGSSLIPFVLKELPLEISKTILWTDSSCVVGWLSSSSKFGRYIDNRINHIRERATIVKHVRTDENPADLGSRGCTFPELAANTKWWHGPSFLQFPQNQWPPEAVKEVQIDHNPYIDSLEDGNDHTVAATTAAKKFKATVPEIEIDSHRFSKWLRLIMSVSAILFFIQKLYRNASSTLFGQLMKFKLHTHTDPRLVTVAEKFLIRQMQQKYPPTAAMKRNLMLKIDADGLFICNHRIPAENDNGLIWLPKCYESDLLIIHVHQKLFHAGPRETLNEIRSRYWICQGKRVVSKAINHNCQHCRLLKLKPYEMPAMPVLPQERIKSFAPFLHIGLDYCGPFTVKQGAENIKCWLILFTCLSTRAIHLEHATGLDSYTFILAFERFMARRGRPNLIISDNQTTLKAASKLIIPCWEQKEQQLVDYVAKERFRWKFITERAAWMGGFYERLIGITKKALSHAVGKRILTLQEFCTIAIRCEAIVNLRPITPVDPEYKAQQQSQMALRPHDFLLPHGNPNDGILNNYDHADDDPDYIPKGITGEDLNKLIHKTAAIIGKFWKLWNVEYINQLRETNLHYHKQHKIANIVPAIGQVVMIEEENIIKNTWKLGIIQELLPSKDNEIRSAKVKTPNGHILNRAICQLYPLELSLADPTSLQTASNNKNSKSAESGAANPEEIAPPRYPLRNRQKPKNFSTLFVLALCATLLIAVEANICQHSSDLELVYVENCTSNGIAVYQNHDGSYCHEVIDCDSDHLQFDRGPDAFLCSAPCKCPEWSDDCSFYAKNITEKVKNELLHLIADETPHDDDHLIHIIELYDSSQHVIRQLNLVKEDVLDDVQCFGEGEAINGSPLYCLNHTCTAEAKKYCVLNHHQNVYALVHNGRIPIKAWKSVQKEFPEIKAPKELIIQASCENGELKIANTKDFRRLQIKSMNSYMVYSPDSYEMIIELPTMLVLAERPLEITVWDIYENSNTTTVTCPPVEFCDRLKPCWICIDELINPHCRPVKSLLFISNIISIAFIIINKCWNRRKYRRNTYSLLVQENVSTKPKRKNSDQMVLPLYRRVSATSMAASFTIIAIICAFVIPTVAADELAITASNEECTTDAHGWLNCTISQVTQFSGSTLKASNLLMNYEGRPLGNIRIEPQLNAICQKYTHHYTRIISTKSTSVKMCPGRDMCTGYACAETTSSTTIKAFGKTNHFPGNTYCTESCGGWYCYCLLTGEACLYYRNFGVPVDGRVLELFSCNEWHIVAAINVTITSQKLPPTSRILTLHEGHSAEIGKVKVSLLDANVEKTIPSLDQYYIATEKTVAMIDAIGLKAAQLLKCDNASIAEQFVNCTLDRDACRCLPADGTVSCSCMENNVLLKLLNKNALPVKLHDHWLEPTPDRNIVARLNAEPRLQVSVQGLQLKSVIDQNSCKAELHKLSGCASCAEGAVATFTCSTDFGNAEAHILCEDTVSFPLKCSQRGFYQAINLFFDYTNVNMKCVLKCPSNTGEILIQGVLHKSVAENPWSVRQVAETQTTSSFIMPIFDALKDFWKASYTIMLVTLMVAAIIAIVVLKVINKII